MKNMNRFCRLLSFFLLLSGISPLASFAQKKDNLGKEFFVAFAENQGSGNETFNFFALFITGKIATQGTVEVPALGFTQSFSITPGKITTIELPDGKNPGDPTVEISTDEQVISGMGVHIIADNEIAVYGISHKQFSSDAFMALPVDVLGTEYRTLNYQTSQPNGIGSVGLPAEFWIVGVTNSTNVKITPKAATSNQNPAGTPFTIQLNKGDVFLVQGNAADTTNDLTGSLIESDKPISVFSGHVRTDIPHGFKNEGSTSTSRDHLVEQMPPVTAWGYSALVAPYATSSLPDLVRIVSHTNANKISVNGSPVVRLNAGDFYEITKLTGPVSIFSSAPILVGQYMHTSRFGTSGGGGTAYGDPAYSLVFPVEQFDTSYTFMVDQDAASFTSNFLNIVTCESGFTDMSLDGKPISSFSGFSVQSFPGSHYAYAQINVEQGDHKISGALPFGITVYAFGSVDSYAYPGGSLLDSFNVTSKHIEYAVSSKKIINNIFGATIHLPIYLKKNGTMPSLEMVMHYPASILTYQGSTLPSGKSIDIPGQQWTGRAKLHIDAVDLAALNDTLAGYCIFTWRPLENDCADVIFDSLDAAMPDDPCTGAVRVTALNTVAKGLIGTSISCGKADVADHKTIYQEEFIFSPNPAKEFGSLISKSYSGKLNIKFVNTLGIKLKDQTLEITAGIAVPLNLEFLPDGVCYMQISCEKFTNIVAFIHLR